MLMAGDWNLCRMPRWWWLIRSNLLNLCFKRGMMNWSTSSSSPESGRHTSASYRPDLLVAAGTSAWNSPQILMPQSASSIFWCRTNTEHVEESVLVYTIHCVHCVHSAASPSLDL